MALYARLADHNIGEIDWEPYTPTFFTRIQKNFNLPVMYKNTNVGECECADIYCKGDMINSCVHCEASSFSKCIFTDFG